MKMIPIPYVRANQAGIVLFIALAIVFQQPLFVYLLLGIQLVSYVQKGKMNMFVAIAKPFVQKWVHKGNEEAAVLQNFNQTIAITMLTISSVLFSLSFTLAGYIVSAIVLLAAFLAICGYCIGCTLYYQLKQFQNKRKAMI